MTVRRSFAWFLLPFCLGLGLRFSIPFSLAETSCCKCTTSGDAEKKICLTIDKGGCGTLGTYYTSNPKLSSLTCEPIDCKLNKLIAEPPGVCSETSSAETYGAAKEAVVSEGDPFEPVVPQLGVPIPGLVFTTAISSDGGVLQIPFLSQYIAAAYKYLVGIVVIASAIMVIYGGFLFIMGSTFTQISTGKKYITDALIGLVLMLSSYTILETLNPDLFSPRSLEVKAIAQKAYDQAALERARVEESARIKPDNEDEEMSVVDVDNPEGAKTPGAPKKPKKNVGRVARDAHGNMVAQGVCPEDMKTIPTSDAYEKVTHSKVQAFCIDTYEAPNQGGKIPYTGITELEADWYCRDHGKRLCTRAEWVRACLGPTGRKKFGYGAELDPGRRIPGMSNPDMNKSPAKCNYDSMPAPPMRNSEWLALSFPQGFYYPPKNIGPDESIFNTHNPKLSEPKYQAAFQKMKDVVASKNRAEPSGKRSTCITDEGVFDMVGNTQEIVVSDAGSRLTLDQRVATQITGKGLGKAYNWMNFFWSPIAHNGVNNANIADPPTCDHIWGGTHEVGARSYENGFRCCLNLDPNATP